MRFRLSTRVTVSVAALLSLAVIGSMVTLLVAWHARQEMARLVMKNEAGTFSALDLTVALLRQRGITAASVLDGGGSGWLSGLRQSDPAFSAGLARADRAADTPTEHQTIARLRQAFQRYDKERAQVVALSDGGQADQARRLYLGDAAAFYDSVGALCDQLVNADKAHTALALVEERAELQRISYFVGGDVVLAAALAGGLVWFLAVGVFRPIRRMALHAGSVTNAAQAPPLTDDLSTLGHYIQSLAAEYAEAQSDLQKSRGELQSASRLAAVGRAVAHVAHEVRNPLAALGALARVIEKRAERPEDVRERARLIYEEVARLERLLTDVMTVSAAPALEPKLQPLNEVVLRTAEMVRVQVPAQVSLRVDCDGDGPQAPLDAGRLEQVILNLLRNAVEALPDGGTVRVSTRACDGGAELVVSDDGPGMPEEVVARAFEAFYTTKSKGTGLGLAVCRQIVLAHGGEMQLETAPGEGTTFTIYLPGAR